MRGFLVRESSADKLLHMQSELQITAALTSQYIIEKIRICSRLFHSTDKTKTLCMLQRCIVTEGTAAEYKGQECMEPGGYMKEESVHSCRTGQGHHSSCQLR